MWCNKSYSILLFATFLACGLTAVGKAAEDDAKHGELYRCAGTYWVVIASAVPVPSELNGLLTLTADGRVILANQIGPNVTAGYGNWEKVRGRSVKGRIINFGFDPPPPVTVDVTFEGEFDRHCEYGELEFELKIYSAEDNPWENTPFPWGNQGTMFARRLPTE